MFKRFLIAALMSLSAVASAEAQVTAAQTNPGYVTTQGCPSGLTACYFQFGPGFNATGKATLAVTNSSSRVALGSTDNTVVVQNTGSVTAYVNLGNTAVTATTSNTPVLAGTSIVINNAPANVDIAGITASGSTSLTIWTGTGIPQGIGSQTSPTPTKPQAVTPVAGTTATVVTGGTAVTMVTGPVNGCYITNPLSATDQGIAVAEVGYINIVGTATTTGNTSNVTIQAGQTFSCPAGMTTNASVNAATSGHVFTVVVW